MKRSALILITAIYLLSIVGMGVNRFYCCGKLASVTLIYGSTDNTGNEAGEKDNCCKNEQQSFKVKDSHISVAYFDFVPSTPAILPVVTNWNLLTVPQEQTLAITYQSNAPPGNPDTPIYTLNCTYRI